MYTICRRATYTEPVSLLVPFSWTGGGVITSLCWNNLVIPKNKSVASRVLHTSPLSNRPVFPRVSSCQVKSSTFYLCENDATFLGLNWRCIERACILENLCFIEVEQGTAILVLFVEIHLSLRESIESLTRTKYRWNRISEEEKRSLLGTTREARKIPNVAALISNRFRTSLDPKFVLGSDWRLDSFQDRTGPERDKQRVGWRQSIPCARRQKVSNLFLVVSQSIMASQKDPHNLSLLHLASGQRTSQKSSL